jgi:spore germination protein KA
MNNLLYLCKKLGCIGGNENMIDFIKNIFSHEDESKAEKKPKKPKHKVTNSLEHTLEYFKSEFDGSADLTIREFEISNTKAAVISISGMIDKDNLVNSVIYPIRSVEIKESSTKSKYEYIRDDILSTAEQIEIGTYEEAIRLVISGFALFQLDDSDKILAIGIQGFSFRGISEPTNEMMQRASKEGFVEPLNINITLVRRRIKNPDLKFETMNVGSISKTDICLCYLKDMVSPKVLENIKERIKKINLETVLEAGYVAPYLEEKKHFSLFSSIGFTERPDIVCAKIVEGRIGILIDGTPNALIVPYLFIEYFQSLDDYSLRPYFATLTRWLKYICFLIAILLPGIFVAMGTFNPELFPNELIFKIAKASAITPFSLMFETLLIYLIYEIMREAGIRLPQALGYSVSLVGALVIGETAVSAGLVGGPTLMVVALTALASYVLPRLYEPIAILRLLFIVAGGVLGIWGVILLFSVVLVDISSKSNCGIPFFSPISPFSLFGMRDVIVRSGWKTLAKKINKIQDMPGSEEDI